MDAVTLTKISQKSMEISLTWYIPISQSFFSNWILTFPVIIITYLVHQDQHRVAQEALLFVQQLQILILDYF